MRSIIIYNNNRKDMKLNSVQQIFITELIKCFRKMSTGGTLKNMLFLYTFLFLRRKLEAIKIILSDIIRECGDCIFTIYVERCCITISARYMKILLEQGC